MAVIDRTIELQLGFMPTSFAIPDADHPGLLRAGPRAGAPYGGESVEIQVCSAIDCAGADEGLPTLVEHGFEAVDLSDLGPLQEVLEQVRVAGRVTDADVSAIRPVSTVPCSAWPTAARPRCSTSPTRA